MKIKILCDRFKRPYEVEYYIDEYGDKICPDCLMDAKIDESDIGFD